MYSVLLCDDDRQILDQLEERVNAEPGFRVVARASTGNSALEFIERLRPEAIFMDIVMPQGDGIHVVNTIRTQMEGYHPVIYILSGMGSNSIIKTLNDLDIDCFSMKPVSLDVVMQNLQVVMKKYSAGGAPAAQSQTTAAQRSIVDTARTVVLRLGALPHRTATICLIDALACAIENPESIQQLTKILYPEVARRHNLNSVSVEKNIRNAISAICKVHTEMFTKIFAYSSNGHITNGEFINVVSEFIKKRMR